mmetsp:Transcript_4051/g.8074  ORF Transcript_4051/g.8074 Transcript_4051/m.8074 type:complete len:200 (+) Transcript_4051:73-672(+)
MGALTCCTTKSFGDGHHRHRHCHPSGRNLKATGMCRASSRSRCWPARRSRGGPPTSSRRSPGCKSTGRRSRCSTSTTTRFPGEPKGRPWWRERRVKARPRVKPRVHAFLFSPTPAPMRGCRYDSAGRYRAFPWSRCHQAAPSLGFRRGSRPLWPRPRLRTLRQSCTPTSPRPSWPAPSVASARCERRGTRTHPSLAESS